MKSFLHAAGFVGAFVLVPALGPALASGKAEITTFSCEITYNAQKSAPIRFEVGEAKSKVKFVDSQGFEMMMTRIAGDRFELEIYDSIKPTRAYSRAIIAKAGDTIGYSLWEREALLEIDCVSLPTAHR